MEEGGNRPGGGSALEGKREIPLIFFIFVVDIYLQHIFKFRVNSSFMNILPKNLQIFSTKPLNSFH